MKPQSVSVAQAIGSPPINLIKTSLVKGKIKCCGPAISVSLELPDNLPDADVIVGIRPDSLRIAGVDSSIMSETDSSGIVIVGELLRSRPMQHNTEIYVRAGIHEILAIVPCESSPHDSRPVGHAVRLLAKPDDVHLFDANSGQRIETSRVG